MELFQGNGQLDEDVEDILYELGNVGVGMVSTTIGSMLGVRAEIGIPVITKADMHIVEQIDKKQTEKIGIYLNFANTLNGAVLLLIVEVLLEQPVAEQKLLTDEESASAIAEFANIIVASYMNAMGSYTGICIFVTPVSVKLGYADELVEDALQNLNLCCNEAICVNTGLSTIDANGGGLSDVGHFIMMPDDASVQKIMEAISI